jgi:general stress protein CsbA
MGIHCIYVSAGYFPCVLTLNVVTFNRSLVCLALQQKVFMVSVENLYFVSAPATDTICTIQKINGL